MARTSNAFTEAVRGALEDVRRRNVRFVDPWDLTARPNQLPPPGDWRIWFLCTGRKFGKTRAANEWVHRKAKERPGSAGFVAGRTLGDVMRTIVSHPESGLLATQKPDNPCEVKQDARSGGLVVRWRNGSFADVHSSEQPDRCRGPMYEWGFADEVATWKRVVDFDGNTAWVNLDFALAGGPDPRMVAASTPRRGSALVKELLDAGAEAGRGVAVTRGTLWDNEANLAKSYVASLTQKYGGTSLWRQEGGGEMLPAVEGAIVTPDLIEAARVSEAPALVRVVVGVDPSGGAEEQGIVAAGLGEDGDLYVLEDASVRLKPEGWGRRAVEAAGRWRGDALVAERNFGGDMVESTIRTVDRNIRVLLPTASRGKHVRFEPVGSLYEQGRVRHVGSFEKLEDEVCCFTPGSYDGEGSPNRADALVWAAFELMGLDKDPAALSPAEFYGVARA